MNQEQKAIIVQDSRYRWHIESPSGKTIMKEVMVNSVKEAEEYIKNYISSFRTWNYEVRPLGE